MSKPPPARVRRRSTRVGQGPCLIIFRGLPGCGKSTRAKAMVARYRHRMARINRDEHRKGMHGGFGDESTERQVTIASHAAIEALLLEGFQVICDDTNLEQRHMDALIAIARNVGARVLVADLRYTPLQVCLERNRMRTGTERLKDEMIEAMYRKHIAPLLILGS